MKIALLYPPPWKLSEPDGTRYGAPDGPPAEFRDGDLDADFYQTPYGLFTLASVATEAGHQSKVLNLSGFAWSKVVEVVRALDADVFGMSTWTANRRGVALVAALIKEFHPNAHVVIGGPHATPFAKEMLEHYPAIDSVCLGESEETFLELLGKIERGESTREVAGTAYRADGGVFFGPKRGSIRKLDELVSPHTYYATHILMTSRGCPWQCTFCGAETTWGRGFRGHSVGYVVDAIESALAKLPVRMLQIKDDTFTANKKRALEICREIRRRKLEFLWSCDTRVDVLDEELLLEMRRAGCSRLSLGVESGSDEILRNIDKKITAAEITAAAKMAKDVGIVVRFYMMLGNRGETKKTFKETVRFLDEAKPHQYVFSCLSIYPGTRDFDDAVKAGWLDPESFFREDFQEYKTPFDADKETTDVLNAWFFDHRGIQNHYVENVPEALAILEKVGDYHAAHLDVAGAYYRANMFDKAEEHAKKALELGTPVPGLALNYLACIALQRRDLETMKEVFLRAAKTDPQHLVLIQNVEKVRAWFKMEGPERGIPLELEARHGFQLLERTLQPTLPGPLPEDFADFAAAPKPIARDLPARSEVLPEGHGKQGFPEKRLRVI